MKETCYTWEYIISFSHSVPKDIITSEGGFIKYLQPIFQQKKKTKYKIVPAENCHFYRKKELPL